MLSVAIAKTNRLWCKSCSKKISLGEEVVFDTIEVNELGERKMIGCYCVKCQKEFHEDYLDNLMQYEAAMSAGVYYGF